MKLTALRPNNPVAVMAAYGALKLLPGARLRWAGANPELDWDGDVIAHLASLLPARTVAPENTLLDDPREKNIGGTHGYRKLATAMPTEWLCAYACETPEGIRASDLLLMGGRHLFVSNAREIMQALTERDVAGKLEEALRGPWRYEDRGLQAWGWDAAARIDAAASPKDVSSSPKFGVVGAYWLAWESLPLWPMVNGRTVGMARDAWTYPTCAEWLSIEGLRTLALGAARLPQHEARALGLTLWRSALLRPSDYGKVLGWATPTTARNPSRDESVRGSRSMQLPDVLIV